MKTFGLHRQFVTCMVLFGAACGFGEPRERQDGGDPPKAQGEIVLAPRGDDRFLPCPIPTGLIVDSDQPITLRQATDEPSCRIAAESVAVLAPSLDGSRPDPTGYSVVGDSEGRFFAGSAGGGTVTVWNADGSFHSTMGRPGEGPGELPAFGSLDLHLTAFDSLYVGGMGRWSVFDPDLAFVRTLLGPPVAPRQRNRVITDQGLFVSAQPLAGADQRAWFHVVDGGGAILRSFGPSPMGAAQHEGEPPWAEGLSLANAGEDSFWVVYAGSEPGFFVLEEWSVEGRLMRSLHRRASWFQPKGRGDPEQINMPNFALHVDPDGLLWLVTRVRSPRWRQAASVEEWMESASDFFESRYEVIEPGSGTVIISGMFDPSTQASDSPQPRLSQWISGTDLSYQSATDTLGYEWIHIFRLRLIR